VRSLTAPRPATTSESIYSSLDTGASTTAPARIAPPTAIAAEAPQIEMPEARRAAYSARRAEPRAADEDHRPLDYRHDGAQDEQGEPVFIESRDSASVR
jgi:hypothetical protein